LPWNAAHFLGNASAEPPAFLKEYVRPDGRIDKQALEAQIAHLQGLR
jgi:hypothetical protein